MCWRGQYLLLPGWEIVGISSVSTCRVLPRTSLQSATPRCMRYTVCDVGVLLGAWMAHTIWHEVQNFSQLASAVAPASPETRVRAYLYEELLILLAACGKLSRFPFSFWVPRAMEGPTPSSAIFYGALLFTQVSFCCSVCFRFGILLPTRYGRPDRRGGDGGAQPLSGRAQSNIRSDWLRIGHASWNHADWFALGFPKLALIHFVANVGLRCYQLLVSPSVGPRYSGCKVLRG
ncbi:MAG: proton-conducting transporter membrane subunit [Bdellovibrionota bacterium]